MTPIQVVHVEFKHRLNTMLFVDVIISGAAFWSREMKYRPIIQRKLKRSKSSLRNCTAQLSESHSGEYYALRGPNVKTYVDLKIIKVQVQHLDLFQMDFLYIIL